MTIRWAPACTDNFFRKVWTDFLNLFGIDHFNTELGVRFSTYAVPMNVPCGNPPIHHKRTAKTIYKGENYAILQH